MTVYEIMALIFVDFKMSLRHPEGTSKNSDNCDFLKVSDIVKSIVVNAEKIF